MASLYSNSAVTIDSDAGFAQDIKGLAASEIHGNIQLTAVESISRDASQNEDSILLYELPDKKQSVAPKMKYDEEHHDIEGLFFCPMFCLLVCKYTGIHIIMIYKQMVGTTIPEWVWNR